MVHESIGVLCLDCYADLLNALIDEHEAEVARREKNIRIKKKLYFVGFITFIIGIAITLFSNNGYSLLIPFSGSVICGLYTGFTCVKVFKDRGCLVGLILFVLGFYMSLFYGIVVTPITMLLDKNEIKKRKTWIYNVSCMLKEACELAEEQADN